MKFTAHRSFRYDIQKCIPEYYEVYGIDNDNNNVIVILQACHLNELCGILQKQRYKFTVNKVLRINRPVLTADGNGSRPTKATEVKLPPGFAKKCMS